MKLTVVFPPHLDFDRMQQRPQRLMEQFARAGHDVLYMNQTYRSLPPVCVEPNLWVVHNPADIHREIHRRRLNGNKTVLFSMWTENWHWHDKLNPDFTVYDYIDDFKEWERNMPKMIDRADLITCTANKLYDNIVERYPDKPVMMLENACEYEHFSKVMTEKFEVPHYLKSAGKPVIGYVGAVAHWVDMDIISNILKEGYTVCAIGPMFGTRLPSHPRLIYVGEKHYKELPEYLQQMDVLIIPFKLNDITKATNPIKMWEYLATGKPVVMTNLPESVKAKGNVDVRNADDFVEGIKSAIMHDDIELKQYRIELAKKNSWKARYEAVFGEIVGRLGQ